MFTASPSYRNEQQALKWPISVAFDILSRVGFQCNRMIIRLIGLTRRGAMNLAKLYVSCVRKIYVDIVFLLLIRDKPRSPYICADCYLVASYLCLLQEKKEG